MGNTDYIVHHSQVLLSTQPGAKVLDFGCGAGEVVAGCVAAGLDAYGCDPYYEGGDLSGRVAAELLAQQRVRRMEGNLIPWPDASFDLVVSNQVFEHVQDLDIAMAEIRRVLKPGGKLLTLFPHKEVWKEPHCGLPFLHWFPERSWLGTLWGAALRTLGLGYFKNNMGRWEWSADFMDWIAKWTHYRSYATLEGMFRKYFTRHEHLEQSFFDYRAADHEWMHALPECVKLLIVRKWAGVVVEARV
jgi:SAM-dependent methyltransferase